MTLMDEKLKVELREFGLLPISLDEVAQEHFKQMGRDPSTIESHYSPGIRKDIQDKMMDIEDYVSRLESMESQENYDQTEYQNIVNNIRENLQYLRDNSGVIPSRKATGGVPLTGTVGVNRDVVPGVESEDLPDNEKAKIHPLNRLHLPPTQQEKETLELLMSGEPYYKEADGTLRPLTPEEAEQERRKFYSE